MQALILLKPKSFRQLTKYDPALVALLGGGLARAACGHIAADAAATFADAGMV